jgi:hypothetical protein
MSDNHKEGGKANVRCIIPTKSSGTSTESSPDLLSGVFGLFKSKPKPDTKPAEKETAKKEAATAKVKAVEEDDEEDETEEEEAPAPVAKASVKKTAKASESKKKEEQESGTEWSVRVAYNASTVYYDGANSELGSGFEAGVFAHIPISNMPLEFLIGANAIYRKPDNKEYMDENEQNTRSELTEYLLSIPALLQYSIEIKEQTFFLQAGAQIDIPLKSEQKITRGSEVAWLECPWRNSYDLGLVLGLGWRINENFALDIRMVRGISEFNKDLGGFMLVQGNIGLSYFF